MRRTTGFLAGFLIVAIPGHALAQVDCSGGCSTTKYGFGIKSDFRQDEVPVDQFRYPISFFGPDFGGQSYFATQSTIGRSDGSCGPERVLSPIAGQVHLREQTGCTPTSEGPLCTAGTNLGAACHLPTLNQSCTGAGAPLACCLGAGRGTCQGFQTSKTNLHECGVGGVCELDPGTGCRVEIPITDGGLTPVASASELRTYTIVHQSPAPNGDLFNLSTATGFTVGGTSFDGVSPETGATCLQNTAATLGAIRRKPTMGTRYLLPANRGGGSGETYIRFDSSAGLDGPNYDDLSTSFRFHSDDSGLCCAPNNPTIGTCSSVVGVGTPNYPLLLVTNCGQDRRFINEDNIVPDWVFAGARGTAFHTDREFILPGQIPGVCRNNRTTPCYRSTVNLDCIGPGQAFDRPLACCTGVGTGTCTANTYCAAPGPSGPPSRQPFTCCVNAGTGTCSDPCATLDADPVAPGVQADTCDLTGDGPRIGAGAAARVAYVQNSTNHALINDPRRDYCGTATGVLRGTPDSGCSILPRLHSYAGDPGPDCGVINYGIDFRYDDNCDGLADFPDLCPRTSEWDQDLDTDADCGTPGSAGFPQSDCRGDECECGDQGGSGVFSGTYEIGNGRVNISDLVAINAAIFGLRPRLRLCDANGDAGCNVSDIVGANREIFVPDSSLCRHITPRQCQTGVPAPCCGNGNLEATELCDDGDFAPGDGCNGACRIEFGFTCTPTSPSVCTPG